MFVNEIVRSGQVEQRLFGSVAGTDDGEDAQMSETDPLHHVLEVEAFIASCRVDGPKGTAWSRVLGHGGPPLRTLYHGSAGIALFYIELYRVTGNPSHIDDAVSAGEDLLAHLEAQDFVSVGFYSGLPGYLFVLNELAKVSGDGRFFSGAARTVQQLADQSAPLGSGIGWIEPMPFSDITGITGDRELLDLSIGAAGAGLGFLYAHRQGIDDRALGWATQTADRLLEMSVESDAGPNWLMMADMPFPFTAPNFAHGAAGVGYFLADLYRVTGEQRYLDTALAAAGYVDAHTSPSGDGHLVCHTEQQPDLNYLGVCHGPPGTGRLMYLLHEITGNDEWLEWIHANMRGLLATGAPEVRSDGLWQNYGQCCGDAGIGDYALSLYRATGRREYLDLARRIETNILANSQFEDGKRWWLQAEHRTRPEFVEAQTGYMQGAAGLGSFLLHLATIDDDATSKIPLADSPFDD
jgi:lantibiotic modifying enzyme